MTAAERQLVRDRLDVVARARGEAMWPWRYNPARYRRLLDACSGDRQQARAVVRLIVQAGR